MNDLFQFMHQSINVSTVLFHIVIAAIGVIYSNLPTDTIALSIAAQRRKSDEPRIPFHVFSSRLQDSHFRLMFRMDRDCFAHLCDTLEKTVGRKKFKSEEYLQYLLHAKTKEGRMYRAHLKTSKGYVSGEVKVAAALRLMAGASYLDVSCIFDIHPNSIPRLFKEVVRDWFCLDEISPLVLDDALEDQEELIAIASKFANGRCSSFTGVIGALDGWLVRVELSSLRRMLGAVSTAGYWSRKGFYALNVQVICDKEKRVLWRSINARGGEHDSKAFKATRLWDKLTEAAKDPESFLNKNRLGIHLYLIADLAYALRSFLITPYHNAVSGSAEDAFNYYHSCNRIVIECCFGEIYARWGIFWKPLHYHVRHHKHVIDAAFKLHNFIINYGIQNKKRSSIEPYKEELMQYMAQQTYKDPIGVYHDPDVRDDGTLGDGRGRPTKIDEDLRKKGKSMRDDVRDHISSQGMCRPRFRNWNRNDCNFVEMGAA